MPTRCWQGLYLFIAWHSARAYLIPIVSLNARIELRRSRSASVDILNFSSPRTLPAVQIIVRQSSHMPLCRDWFTLHREQTILKPRTTLSIFKLISQNRSNMTNKPPQDIISVSFVALLLLEFSRFSIDEIIPSTTVDIPAQSHYPKKLSRIIRTVAYYLKFGVIGVDPAWFAHSYLGLNSLRPSVRILDFVVLRGLKGYDSRQKQRML